MESVSSSGIFAETSCPRLLVRLHLQAFTGTVRISVGAVLKLLYFQAGEIAMASSNDQADHLAPILMRAGKLKTEQLDLARKQAKAGTSLARVLVQMGFLTSGELFAGARQQLRQIVASVLGLTEGRYDVQEGYFPREVTSLNVDTRELLLDLIKDLPERSFVLLEVGAPDTVYSPSSPPPPGEAQAPPKLPRAWQAHAAQLSDPMTIHAFGQGAGLDDFSASKVVYALHLFGLLVAQPAEQESEDILPEELAARAAAGSATAARLPPLASPAGPARIEVAAAPPPAEEAPEPPPPEVAAPNQPAPPAQPIFTSTSRPAEEIFRTAAAQEPEQLEERKEPIRMEFKGTLPAARGARSASSPWGILSVITGVALLAAGFVWFVFLRGSPVPASPQPAAREEAPGPEAAILPEPGPDSQAPTGESENPPQESPAAPPSPSPPSAAASSVESSSTKGEPAAAAGQAGASQDSTTGSRRAAPRSLLDAGNAEAAAAGWLSALMIDAPGGFTLQLSIACRQESVRKAAERTRDSADFFIVPFTLQGKACYRLCWGSYPTLAEAEAGKSAVPGFFLDEGAQPLVVSVARLDDAAGKR
jgi:uncharacterized protein DUF4388